MIKKQLERLVKGSFIYGLGSILNRFLSFLILPLFTRYLNPEDYGIMAMLALLNMFLTGIFSLGTGNSMGIFYFKTEDKVERREIIWTNFVLVLINTLVLISAGLFFAPKISQILLGSENHAYLVSLSLAGLGVNIITMPFHSYLRMEEKAKTFVVLTSISTLMLLGMSVFAVVFLGRGVRGMIESNLISGIVILIASIVIVRSSLRISFNMAWIPKLIKIGYPSIFGLGAFFIIDWLDRVMIQRMVGMEELGIYSIGYSIGMIMLILAEGTFGSAWPPYFMSFINKKDEAIMFFGKIFKYYLLAYGTLTLLFFISARFIIVHMTTIPFHGAYTVVGLVACSYMLKVCYLIMLPGLYYEGKLYIQTGIEWVAAIINIGLNFLLIPLFHKEGAAIATLLSYISLPILVYFAGQKFLPVKYEWKPICKFIAIFIVVSVTSYVHFIESIWINFAINGVIFIVFCFVVFYFILSHSERKTTIDYMVMFRSVCLRGA